MKIFVLDFIHILTQFEVLFEFFAVHFTLIFFLFYQDYQINETKFD